jgi:glyoxylase-like metal-dependent hydrolase (beta-lactamase superfamily II)
MNTHLHSDHGGGNAAIQRRWDSEAWVPEATFEAARDWDHDRLTYRATDQRCDQFAPTAAITAGSSIEIGGRLWWVLAAPGHDAQALMYFEPQSGTLISGDALWEDRLAINFPELDGEEGFLRASARLHRSAKSEARHSGARAAAH